MKIAKERKKKKAREQRKLKVSGIHNSHLLGLGLVGLMIYFYFMCVGVLPGVCLWTTHCPAAWKGQ